MEHAHRKPYKHKFSIIVPVLNEQGHINSFINKIKEQGFDGFFEVIIVDGDSDGRTINAVRDTCIICLTSPKGRGRQMNAGAAVARGEILIFLHADTTLPDNGLGKINQALQNNDYVGGAFDLQIDSDRLFLRYISVRASLRSRFNRIPYGDQAIFVRKKYFDHIGGFKDIPLMEDVDLMRRIKKDRKNIIILPDKVITSARRWESDGALYTTIRNQILVGLFYLGVSPHKLAKHYWRKS
ncbi:MAG: TIGR04283 family arsenosugar biosynthesis glycosyltransferase [Planctomycetota bacterium]|jgi:rSAM/selenodomain-associated transferase 2